MHIGYCGNVHPGRTIDEVKSNLELHTLDVKSQFRPNEPLEIGLWLSETAAHELDDENRLFGFRDWLADKQLRPFTLNGFPFGDFHEDVVKHSVYQPTWADPDRLDYTLRLARIISILMPPGATRTISTLPLGWPTRSNNHRDQFKHSDPSFLESCARHLRICSERLAEIEQSTGDNVILCIEPEPGCVLDTCDDIIDFFGKHLRCGNSTIDHRLHHHIGVCHDICHSAVMFEEQAAVIDAYDREGIRVGKIQVSSAVEADFDDPECDQGTLLEQLSGFAEPRYLHQTMIRTDQATRFFEDLSLAIADNPQVDSGLWRVHFHVPIFSESLGEVGTTQSDIARCIQAIMNSDMPIPHFEIETYAWNVLPAHLQSPTLADGIAKELAWFDKQLRTMHH